MNTNHRIKVALAKLQPDVSWLRNRRIFSRMCLVGYSLIVWVDLKSVSEVKYGRRYQSFQSFGEGMRWGTNHTQLARVDTGVCYLKRAFTYSKAMRFNVFK